MGQIKTNHVAIVGGGPGCKAIMDMIFAEKLGSLEMKLIGVADVNPEAVGYRYAREKGIHTTTDYHELYKLKDLHMIIEVTGDEKVADEICQTKPVQVRFLDHVAARLFWNIDEIEEERIAGRKRAEEALCSANRKLQAIFSAIQEDIHIVDSDFNLVHVSGTLIKLFGLPDKESVLGRKCFEALKGRKEVCSSCAATEAYRTKSAVYRAFKSEDEVSTKGRMFEVFAYPIVDEGGTVTEAVQFARDITEREQGAEALRRSEQKFRDLTEVTTDWVWEVDEHGVYTYVSPKIKELLGYEVGEVLGKTPLEFMAEEDAENSLNAFSEEIINKEPFSGLENVNRHKDGHLVVLETSGIPIFDEKGQLRGYRGIDRDITKRRQMEEQLKASLAEKEVLLKEIHHRVKNNLQIICSMLYLQSRHIEDTQLLAIFAESQHRIKSIALAHEELYQSKSLANIEFADYVRNLLAYLFSSYGVNSDLIALKTNLQNMPLGVDVAIPCALIINELIPNSLKHAFPAGRERGEIYIDCRSEDADKAALIVSDNGVGFPRGMDFRNTKSFGLRLVNMLVGQLNGAMELDGNSGTTFRLTFPIPKKSRQRDLKL